MIQWSWYYSVVVLGALGLVFTHIQGIVPHYFKIFIFVSNEKNGQNTHIDIPDDNCNIYELESNKNDNNNIKKRF